jgi:large subunit ribosomal protein L9
MKVILIAVNPRLGKIGDIVEVKSGYAKNFLIPQKQAICFTSSNYKVFESKKHEFEQENSKNLDAAAKVKAKIEGKDILIIQNASDDGRLYGSVNSSVIAARINETIKEKSILRSQIFLKKSIKEIGVYEAVVNLHSDVKASLRLIVTRSESEVDALLKAAAKGNAKEVKEEVVSSASAVEDSSEEKVKKVRKPRKAKEETAE